MKLTDFITIIRAAEHFKHEANSRDEHLMRASRLISRARPDTFWIRSDEVIIPDAYESAFGTIGTHHLVREFVTQAPQLQWGAAFGRPIPSTLSPDSGSWSQ